jgi:hypothetical protein
MVRRIRIGYVRVKEIRGLLRFEVVPISREEALAIPRGERTAGKS